MVTHLGKIQGTCICEHDGKKLIFEKEFGQIQPSDIEKINTVIDITNYYDLSKGSGRYYLISDLKEVNIEKSSAGGMRGHRYFDLQELANGLITDKDNLSAIAEKVANSSFE